MNELTLLLWTLMFFMSLTIIFLLLFHKNHNNQSFLCSCLYVSVRASADNKVEKYYF